VWRWESGLHYKTLISVWDCHRWLMFVKEGEKSHCSGISHDHILQEVKWRWPSLFTSLWEILGTVLSSWCKVLTKGHYLNAIPRTWAQESSSILGITKQLISTWDCRRWLVFVNEGEKGSLQRHCTWSYPPKGQMKVTFRGYPFDITLQNSFWTHDVKFL